jgi:hypothetical protein
LVGKNAILAEKDQTRNMPPADTLGATGMSPVRGRDLGGLAID